MKRIIIIALFALMTLPMLAQSNDKKPGINKENCTFTNKDGKTFNLYGKVKIVEHFNESLIIIWLYIDFMLSATDPIPQKASKKTKFP